MLAVGERLAGLLRGGEILVLQRDVGGGKTTLTRGIVKGLAASDHVSSPTFTITHEYTSGRLHVYHIDLYRLGDLGLLGEVLDEMLDDTHAVMVVEWAGLARDRLPRERCIDVSIERVARSEDSRDLTIEAGEDVQYMLAGLKP